LSASIVTVISMKCLAVLHTT